MKLLKSLLGGAALLAMSFPAVSNAATANVTVTFAGIGSSALFLQLGEAAAFSKSPDGIYPQACAWTATSGGKTVYANDPNNAGVKETGQAWVTWNVGNTAATTKTVTKGTCAAPVPTATHPVNISFYLQTDSVVGDRCLFNGCTVTFPAAGTGSGGVLTAVNPTKFPVEATLPSLVQAAINNYVVNASGTDIRPEDAAFATLRATTDCGTPVVPGSQYLGLGYPNQGQIVGFTGSTFNVVNFSLPTNFTVTPLGASPIVVAVSYNALDGANVGFNNANIKSINSSTLAGFLDGTLGMTDDVMTPGTSGDMAEPVTVFLREPLSGTYNTMEYNVPNTVQLQTSQDVGLNQPSALQNCNGLVPAWNAQSAVMPGAGTGRERAIGTGQELTDLFGTTNGLTPSDQALGYAFWSRANFALAPTTAAASGLSAKYLMVDGVDPIETNYGTAGVIPSALNSPTGTSDLGSVTLAHIKDGTYPIWSLLRLVNIGSTVSTGVSDLATAAQTNVTFGANGYPDFVPATSLWVERSHFTPPGVTLTNNPPFTGVQNGACVQPENGGDVGGVVLTCQMDIDYNNSTGSTYINHRR